jgi:para-aminobenzoate synthetase component I
LAKRIDILPDEFVPRLLSQSRELGLCLLDSCNAEHIGSHRLIAGIDPIETRETRDSEPEKTLRVLDEILSGDQAAIFTLSYDFGKKLQSIGVDVGSDEPDFFIAIFDSLVINDYRSGETSVHGNERNFKTIIDRLSSGDKLKPKNEALRSAVTSNSSRKSYLEKIEEIKERIRRGDTYQTNLTQQLTARIHGGLSTATIFDRIRKKHPAPFAALIERPGSTVISASPERFFRVENGVIEAAPIKGTRPRGRGEIEDRELRNELLSSEKDRAENTMIVDLLRNDLGRVSEYGSVEVTSLCKLQTLPTVFHLVSTIRGRLRADAKPSDIIRSLFPSGSITGAPKISTMRIIDELERSPRGLSMGAIGVYIPSKGFDLPEVLDLSVAIRTMVVRDGEATFNVGGGITIESDAENEYEESWSKAAALLDAMGIERPAKTL